jgi:hypothetical protein
VHEGIDNKEAEAIDINSVENEAKERLFGEGTAGRQPQGEGAQVVTGLPGRSGAPACRASSLVLRTIFLPRYLLAVSE